MEVAAPFTCLRAAIPRGRRLSPEVFRSRHRVIVGILLVHAVGIAIFAIARGNPVAHSVLESSIVAALAALALWEGFSQKIRGTLAGMGLVTSSALLVHFGGGAIEMHFHFFVVLGLLTLYQDWMPYGLALLYVVVHHGTMGVLHAESVYNHPAAQQGPWLWAGIHGGFVLAACIVQLFSWSVNEAEHDRAESYRLAAREGETRRRQALQINDSIVQGLVVAQMAHAVGEQEQARSAIAAALEDARGIIGELLDANGTNGMHSGALAGVTLSTTSRTTT